jgi:uncharacterized membrane protein YsdA (DUF1294 family)
MPRRRSAPTSADSAGTLALALFALAFALGVAMRGIPAWIGWLYLLASAACFVAYAVDKLAARGSRGRIPEAALLWLGALGGWPGAIVAQRVWRHKTAKRPFRSAFRLTVLANVVVLAALLLLPRYV